MNSMRIEQQNCCQPGRGTRGRIIEETRMVFCGGHFTRTRRGDMSSLAPVRWMMSRPADAD
jgi:hypothetical protein